VLLQPAQLTYEEKEERAKALCAAFDRLPTAKREGILYDAVYVDEAQDLLPGELEFLRRLAREEGGKQTLVIFYDNAQNIYAVPAPTWSDLGINIVGRTNYLDTCLRNTEEVLALGFNVLVGSCGGSRFRGSMCAGVAGAGVCMRSMGASGISFGASIVRRIRRWI
jgi:hypothetical protein